MKPIGRPTRCATMRSLLLLALAFSAPALASSSGDKELARLLAGRTAGKPQSCIPIVGRSNSQTIAGIGIVYGSGKTVWLNRFTSGCENAFPGDVVVTVTPAGNQCKGDFVRLVDPVAGALRGVCALGDYVPYTRAK